MSKEDPAPEPPSERDGPPPDKGSESAVAASPPIIRGETESLVGGAGKPSKERGEGG